MKKFYLIVAKGSKKGMPIPITVDLFLIGSDRMCQLRAKNLPREQCALIIRENKVFVRDMGSDESTLVNDAPIPVGSEWPLHAGDRLEIGSLQFVVQFHEKGMAQKDMEEWAASCLDTDIDRNVYQDEAITDEIPNNAADAAASIINRLNAEKGQLLGRLRIGVEKGITVVRVNDTKLVEDSEIALVKKELCDNLNRNNLRVLLDRKNLARVSSAAVVMIREFSTWLRSFGSKMAICRVKADLSDILSAFAKDRIPIFASKDQALDGKW